MNMYFEFPLLISPNWNRSSLAALDDPYDLEALILNNFLAERRGIGFRLHWEVSSRNATCVESSQ